MPNKDKNIPKRRFKEFENADAWELRKLGDTVIEIIAGGDIDKNKVVEFGKYPIYANSHSGDGIVGYYDDFYRVNGPAVTVTGRGEVGFAKARETDFTPVVRLLAIRSKHNHCFLENAINLHGVTVESTGVPQLTVPQLSAYRIYFPYDIQEENQIGTFFSTLDQQITLHQRKLDLLKEQKKGFLQKMFPKNGAKVPELRFAGFADDWEERKLSSGLREYTDRVIVEDDKEYYQISVRNNFGGITLRGSKMGNKIGRKRQAKINLTKYPQTLIFTRQTVEQGGIGWVDKYCDGAIVTENMPTISLDTSVFSKYFLTNLFQTRIFYKNAILDNVEGGSAQIAIHESKFLSSTLLFPNLDEQEKIGQFFKQLDNTITLHQRKLDLLKEQKKGFLQKMFV